MEPIDAGRLSELCWTNPFVRRVVLLEETGSTNDEAQRMAAEGARKAR
jgi:hypothetical protein